jgi:hypothetical protein
MTAPTGNKPTDPEPPGDTSSSEQPYRRWRSPYAVKLREIPQLDEVAQGAPEKRPGLLKIIALIAGLGLLWLVFTFSGPQETPPPAAVPLLQQPKPPEIAASTPEPSQEGQGVPTYRRLSDEELRQQLPPGATIVE